MIYHVTLKKRSSSHQNLRDDEIRGVTDSLPEVGEGFKLVADSRTPGAAFRMILTSPVERAAYINEDDSVVGVYFTTRNSFYELEISHVEQG